MLQSEIKKLDSMPSRYPLTEEKTWHTKEIHKMPIKNFLIYYLVDEERKTVWVTAVIYAYSTDSINEIKEILTGIWYSRSR